MKEYKVYFIQQQGKGNQPVKIGVSSNPDKRLQELQVGNPFKLKIRATIICQDERHAYSLEKRLHIVTSKRFKRLSGEWFMTYGNWMRILDEANNGFGFSDSRSVTMDTNKETDKKIIKRLRAAVTRLDNQNSILEQRIEELEWKLF